MRNYPSETCSLRCYRLLRDQPSGLYTSSTATDGYSAPGCWRLSTGAPSLTSWVVARFILNTAMPLRPIQSAAYGRVCSSLLKVGGDAARLPEQWTKVRPIAVLMCHVRVLTSPATVASPICMRFWTGTGRQSAVRRVYHISFSALWRDPRQATQTYVKLSNGYSRRSVAAVPRHRRPDRMLSTA